MKGECWRCVGHGDREESKGCSIKKYLNLLPVFPLNSDCHSVSPENSQVQSVNILKVFSRARTAEPKKPLRDLSQAKIHKTTSQSFYFLQCVSKAGALLLKAGSEQPGSISAKNSAQNSAQNSLQVSLSTAASQGVGESHTGFL